jgi:hypothetical protein
MFMKKKLYMDELESFIAESADEVRMYPSDRVWLNIDKRLRGERKWPALTFGAVLTGAILLAGLIFLQPDKDLFEIKPLVAPVPAAVAAGPAQAAIAQNHQHTAPLVATASKVANPAAARYFNEDVSQTAHHHSPAETGSILPEAGSSAEQDMMAAASLNEGTEEAGPAGPVSTLTSEYEAQASLSALSQTERVEVAAYYLPVMAAAQPPENPQSFDRSVAPRTKASLQEQASDRTATPIVSPGAPASRWTIQYYGAPSISYRILTEEKNFNKDLFTNGQIPAAFYNNVTRLVHHREGLGLEAGAAIGYKATDKLTLTAGLQLNYRQYTIEAFEGAARASALRLQTPNGVDTLMAVSNVINYSSNQSVEVQNRYLQVSLPIGFELAVASFSKLDFVLAANIQPTYNLYQNAWLISSDYQRYVQEPTLMRGWNVNSGVGAYIRFATKGGLQWQAGPQIRYQLMSSFAKEYHVRENLIDYGFRIGVSKTLK